jgi:sigma-E factor negative regulatory protein RseC
MIETRAHVLDVRDDLLLLEAESASSCSACGVRQGCGTSVLSRWLGRRFTRFTAPNTVSARAGDDVVVGIAEDALLSGSVMVYLVPLLAMILSALAADGLLAADADMRDLIVIALTAAGFGLSLWFSRLLLASGRRRAAMQPVVLRKLEPLTPVTFFSGQDARTSDRT